MRYAFFNRDGRVDSAHNDNTCVVMPEGAVELTEKQFEDRFNLRFAEGEMLIEANLLPLDVAKDHAWRRIKAERDRRKSGGAKAGGYWFHTDDTSRIQYSILDGKATRSVLPGSAVFHPEWKTMSGEKTPMTVALLRQIIDVGIANDGAVFDAAEKHRVAMEASAAPADYDFSAGWPEIYMPVTK